MPSYVIHLACAKQMLKYCKPMDPEDVNRFYLGSIVADMVQNKKRSHFWDDETYRYLERKPNLSMFLEQYGDNLRDPYVFGYYGHLYLDRMFLEQYWDRHFLFFDANQQPETEYDAVKYVKVAEQNQVYDRETFFSKALYYGDYDRMNAYFAREYELEFPDPDSVIDHWNNVSRIKEIDWEESLPILRDAISLVTKSTSGVKKRNQKPPLNIFLLSELETMIDFAAKEMARRHA